MHDYGANAMHYMVWKLLLSECKLTDLGVVNEMKSLNKYFNIAARIPNEFFTNKKKHLQGAGTVKIEQYNTVHALISLSAINSYRNEFWRSFNKLASVTDYSG